MERSLFFNSAPGDPRVYQASDFADYFGSVLFTGLLHVNGVPGLAVNVETGTLNTVVSPGGAIMEGYLYENTSDLTLTHDIPEASLDRIDRIVLRLDLRNAERNIKVHVKEGTAAASPTAPALQRDNFIYELSLAQIRVRANTVQLLQSDLIDERLNDELCGLVKSLITDGVSEISFNEHLADHTDHVYFAVDTGTANAKVISISPTPTSYKVGLGVSWINKFQNTGPVTINVDGLGNEPLLKSNGNQLVSGSLKQNSVYTARHNGTAFILQGEGGEYGTAGPEQVLTGYTIGTDNGVLPGTFSGKKFATGSLPSMSANSGNIVISGTGIGFVPNLVVVRMYVNSQTTSTMFLVRQSSSFYPGRPLPSGAIRSNQNGASIASSSSTDAVGGLVSISGNIDDTTGTITVSNYNNYSRTNITWYAYE